MPTDLPLLTTLAALIEFGGAVIVAAAVVRALAQLTRGAGPDGARRLVIEGALSALGFKTAATALKAIELGTWHGIGMFATIFALRTLIKQALLRERAHLVYPSTSPVRTGRSELRLLGRAFRAR